MTDQTKRTMTVTVEIEWTAELNRATFGQRVDAVKRVLRSRELADELLMAIVGDAIGDDTGAHRVRAVPASGPRKPGHLAATVSAAARIERPAPVS